MDLNDQRIKKLITFAYETVPYYNNLFNSNNIDVYQDDITEILSRIPITDKETIKKIGWPNFINNNYLDDNNNIISNSNIHITQTSGTTGEPMHILWNSKDYYHSVRNHWLLRYKIANIKATDRCCSISHNNKGRRAYELSYHYFKIKLSHITYMQAVDYLKKWTGYDPVWLYMPASVLSFLVNIARREKIDIRGNIRYIEFAEEPVIQCYRQNIENYFGFKAYDMYGCQEANGIAMQCRYNNYHLMDNNIHAEVLSDDILSKYGHGNLCITGLYNTAMPFIKYKLNDVVTIKENICKCGANSPLIEIHTNRFPLCTEIIDEKATILYPSRWFDDPMYMDKLMDKKTIRFTYLFDKKGSTFILENSTRNNKKLMLQIFEKHGYSINHLRIDSIKTIDTNKEQGVFLIDR